MVMVMLVLFGKLTSHKSMGVVVVFEQMYWLFFLLSQVDEHGHGHDGIVRQMYSLFTTQWAWSWSLWSCLANVLTFQKLMGMAMVMLVLLGKCIDFSQANWKTFHNSMGIGMVIVIVVSFGNRIDFFVAQWRTFHMHIGHSCKASIFRLCRGISWTLCVMMPLFYRLFFF